MRDSVRQARYQNWVELDKVWAEKLRVKPSERFIQTSARTVNTSQTRFKIRQRGDLDETMRVLDDNAVTWNIIGLIKNDRQFLTLQVGHLARSCPRCAGRPLRGSIVEALAGE